MRFNLQLDSFSAFSALKKGALLVSALIVPEERLAEVRLLRPPQRVRQALEVHAFDRPSSLPDGLRRLVSSCGVEEEAFTKRLPTLIEVYDQGVISIIGFDIIQDYWDRVTL